MDPNVNSLYWIQINNSSHFPMVLKLKFKSKICNNSSQNAMVNISHWNYRAIVAFSVFFEKWWIFNSNLKSKRLKLRLWTRTIWGQNIDFATKSDLTKPPVVSPRIKTVYLIRSYLLLIFTYFGWIYKSTTQVTFQWQIILLHVDPHIYI